MATRIRRNNRGDLTLPQELLEDKAVEEGTLFEAHRDAGGDVVLHRITGPTAHEYADEDLAMFAEEDKMTPDLEDRLSRLLSREPRLFRR